MPMQGPLQFASEEKAKGRCYHKMSRFMNSKYASLEAYTPGEQPKERKYIKLNTNESPYPPSEGVRAVLSGECAQQLNLYCDPEATALRLALAQRYELETDEVFVSNGSDEILYFSFMAFGEKGACFADITYGFYSVYADFCSVEPTVIPLREDFSLDVDRFCNQNKLIVIANPNAPTGMTISIAQIERILQTNPDNIVLIDEAYIDFGGSSCYNLIRQYKNLLVVRTYSKAFSMAGARLGYAFGDRSIISDLAKIKYSTNPYNVNSLTQAAGAAVMRDYDYYKANCQKIAETREATVLSLGQLGYELLPSQANFIFARHPRLSGEEIYTRLRARGILVRYFGKGRIKDFVRISIGSREQMQALVAVCEEIVREESL